MLKKVAIKMPSLHAPCIHKGIPFLKYRNIFTYSDEKKADVVDPYVFLVIAFIMLKKV